MEFILPFAVFAGFLLFFASQARREGKSVETWLADRNAAVVYKPGWWKPAAALVGVMVVVFLAYLTIDQGFRWAYLLVVPIFAGFFGASVVVLSWFFRRQFRGRRPPAHLRRCQAA